MDDYHGAQVEMPAADKLPIPPVVGEERDSGKRTMGFDDLGIRYQSTTIGT